MTRPRQSTLVATALVLVAILLGVTAVLLGSPPNRVAERSS